MKIDCIKTREPVQLTDLADLEGGGDSTLTAELLNVLWFSIIHYSVIYVNQWNMIQIWKFDLDKSTMNF